MARIICQAVDELGNIYLLKDDGLLEKRDSSNVLIWGQQVEQEPTTGNFVFANQFTLDLNSDVWLTYSDELNVTIRSTTDGVFVTEILNSAANVIVSKAGGDRLFALSTSRALLYEMDRDTKALIRSFDLTEEIPDFQKDIFVNQMTSSAAKKIWFGAVLSTTGEVFQAQLVRFDPAGDGEFTLFPLSSGIPHPVAGADDSGNVYLADLNGNIFRFDETTDTFDAMYVPPAPGGVINILTFTDTNEVVLQDDGTFAFAGSKTRIFDPANGDVISTVSSTNVGTICGDTLGYHHIKLTRIDIPPSPITPVVDTGKLDVFVQPDGTITATGRPGAVTDADTVDFELDAGPTPIGSVAPNPDGSFSITSAAGAAVPTGEAVTLKFIKGIVIVPIATTSIPRTLPTGFTVTFETQPLALVGEELRIKAKIKDSVGAIVVPAPGIQPIFRLKLDAPGTFFNTNTFVPDNGDYNQPTFDTLTELWGADITIPSGFSGSATFFIDGSVFSTNILIIPNIADKVTLDEVKTVVDELNAKVDIAFGAPAGQFTDPLTIGGFIFEKLVDIQKNSRRLIAGIVGSRNVVVESIVIDVSTQAVPKGSTPSIDVTVFDEERRFPLDISGSKLFLKAKTQLESEILIINREGEIISGTDGLARIKLTAVDTATAQRLTAQIVVEIPGTGTLLSPAFFLDIQESVL